MAELALAYRPDLVQVCWDALQAGEFLTDAAARVGTSRTTVRRLLRAAGGVRPRRGRGLEGRYLSFAEREEIAVGRAAGPDCGDRAGVEAEAGEAGDELGAACER